MNHKIPEDELQAQWEAIGNDPEASMRVSNKFAELRDEALVVTNPLRTDLYEEFYRRFVLETGATLTLFQYATIAEDARRRRPRTKYAQLNEITKLRKYHDMNATKAMAEADVKPPVALHDDTIPLDGFRGLYNLGSTCYANSVWKMLAVCDVFVSAVTNLDRSNWYKRSCHSVPA